MSLSGFFWHAMEYINNNNNNNNNNNAHTQLLLLYCIINRPFSCVVTASLNKLSRNLYTPDSVIEPNKLITDVCACL